MDPLIALKLEKFFSQFQTVSLKKGEIILHAGENPENIFYLKKGYVRMYSISEAGKELTLNIFKPKTYFPMIWAIAQIPNNYFFETMTEIELSHVPKKELIEFFKKEPKILYDLSKRVLVGLEGILIRLQYLLFGNAYSRVAAMLLLAASRFGIKNKNNEIEIQLTFTHQEIANLAGLTREATSLEMKKLEKKGLVLSENKQLIIKSPEKLREESLIYIEEKPLPYTF